MHTLNVKRDLSFQNNREIEVTIATNAGACFGVIRAIKLGKKGLEASKEGGNSVYSLGALIHNPTVVNELREQGLEIAESPEAITEGTVVFRSHGVRKEIEKSLKEKGLETIDATCPLVKKPQRIAESLGQKGYFLVLVGDKNHPEIQGVLSYFGRSEYLVTYQVEELQNIPSEVRKVGIVAQTTIELKVFEAIIQKCKERFEEVVFYNTICDATSIRQREAEELSKKADVFVVVGGKNSSNTNKLVKICKQNQKDTYHIEEMQEIDPNWFIGKTKIAVTGGASTPHEFVDNVGSYIASLVQNNG